MPEKYEFTEFAIEYHNELSDNPALFDEADARLRELARGHHDIAGALVNIKETAQGKDHGIQATVTVYTRPNYIAATEEARTPEVALKVALDEVERQVRNQREKLRGY